MKSIPYYEPDEVVQGESHVWLLSLPDYLPQDGWVVTYGFVSAAQKSSQITGVDNGDGTHKFTLTAAITQNFAPDLYYYQAFAALGIENVLVRQGRLTVQQNLSSLTVPYDNRSNTKKILDQINDLLAGRTVRDVDSYTINGRSLVKMKIPELIQLQNHYQAAYDREIRNEKVKRGDRLGGTIRTRFNAMSRPAGFGRMRGR